MTRKLDKYGQMDTQFIAQSGGSEKIPKRDSEKAKKEEKMDHDIKKEDVLKAGSEGFSCSSSSEYSKDNDFSSKARASTQKQRNIGVSSL